jgi:hypothetical protein
MTLALCGLNVHRTVSMKLNSETRDLSKLQKT